MSAHNTLVKAREVIAAGWTQNAGVRINPDGSESYCIVGALDKAVIDGGFGYREWEDARNALKYAIGVAGLSFWNDTPGRIQEEVLEVFDKAIEATRAS